MADNKLAGWLLAANRSCHEGNLALAELICRHILETVGNQQDALALLGLIALKVRMYDFAIDNLGKALKLDKNNVLARKYLRIARACRCRFESAGWTPFPGCRTLFIEPSRICGRIGFSYSGQGSDAMDKNGTAVTSTLGI